MNEASGQESCLVGRASRLVQILVVTAVFLANISIFSVQSMVLGNKSIVWSRNSTEISYSVAEPWLMLFGRWVTAVWLAYAFSTLCRPRGGDALFFTVPYLSSSLFLAATITLLIDITWTLTWGSIGLAVSFWIHLGQAVAAWSVCWLCISSLVHYGPELIQRQHLIDVRITRVLVLNMMGIYAMCATMECLVILASSLKYVLGIVEPIASAFSLTLLMTLSFCWAVIEMTSLDIYTRAFAAPYVKLVVYSSQIGFKDTDSSVVQMIEIALLCEACVLLFVKFAVIIVRGCRYGVEPLVSITPGEQKALVD